MPLRFRVSSYWSFVTHQFNVIPPLATAADVGTYTYGYAINVPDKFQPTQSFAGLFWFRATLARKALCLATKFGMTP